MDLWTLKTAVGRNPSDFIIIEDSQIIGRSLIDTLETTLSYPYTVIAITNSGRGLDRRVKVMRQGQVFGHLDSTQYLSPIFASVPYSITSDSLDSLILYKNAQGDRVVENPRWYFVDQYGLTKKKDIPPKVKAVRSAETAVNNLFRDREFRRPLLSERRFLDYFAQVHFNARNPDERPPLHPYEKDLKWAIRRSRGVASNEHEPRNTACRVAGATAVLGIAAAIGLRGDFLPGAEPAGIVGMFTAFDAWFGYRWGELTQGHDNRRITEHLFEHYAGKRPSS